MAEIGKNIIENLTTAMYENSYTVYREYIQNSADSIDKAIESGLLTTNEAFIDITIDEYKRKVSIYDNACGISKDSFRKVLSNIADSQKDRTKEKGFRGIGRLAGIAYCKKLSFKSSYKGENVMSIMTWDGDMLRNVLSDKNQHPSASDLVDRIIDCKEEKCDADNHFFEVIMDGVIPESDNLINKHDVIEYLQEVAPVPYSNAFVFKSKIYDFAKQNGFSIDEYKIEINGNPLHKPYKTTLYKGTTENKTPFDEIKDVEFEIIQNKKGEVLGWLWYGISKFEKQIPIINQMRGIRVRKENIQIGNYSTLVKMFKEERGNGYFVGEVFVTHPNLIPNARRDYFNTNSSLKEFENALYPLLYNDLYKLYYYANGVKNDAKKVAEYTLKKNEYNERLIKGSFISKEDQENAARTLEETRKKAETAQRNLEKAKEKSDNSSVLKRVFEDISDTYKVKDNKKETEVKDLDDKKKKTYLTQSLSKYSKKEQKLISTIYEIIKKILPYDTAELVIQKIQEELK